MFSTHINFFKRITSSAMSSLILACGMLLVFKYSHFFGNYDLIYIYNWGQVISGVFVTLFIYGVKFEISDEILLNIKIPIFISLFVFLFAPLLGLSFLLLTRIYQQKMGVQTTSSQFVTILISLILSSLYILVDGNVILIIIVLISMIPPIIARENYIRIPEIKIVNLNLMNSVIKRSSLDLSLILPILAVNFLSKKYFTTSQFIEISQLLFCLNVLSIVTSLLEKVVFDSSLLSKFSDSKIIYSLIIVVLTYISVLILGVYFQIRIENWWYLLVMPLINIKFAFELAIARKIISSSDGLIVSLYFFYAFSIMAVIGASIYVFIGNPFFSVTVPTAMLAIIQIFIIKFKRSAI